MFKPKIRFLHSADLHLDSPFKGLRGLPNHIYEELVQSTIATFHRLIDLAIEEQVDFVLIVGDLFDQESSSIKSSIELKKGLERLHKHGIDAYISYGNHDFMMQKKAKLTFPQNTHIFPSNEVTSFTYQRNGQLLAEISGFSYSQRAVTEGKVNHYKRRTDAPYYIGTLHGSLKSNREHDRYAPFTIEELSQVDADYWALGHIHKRFVINQDPLAVYPGNTQARHMKETGEKGCYIVELNNDEPQLTFYSLQDVLFTEEEVGLEDIDSPTDLMDKLNQFKETLRENKMKMMVRLTIHLHHSNWISPEELEDLMDTLNLEEEDEKHWIWISEAKILDQLNLDDELIKSNPFISEILQTIEQKENLDYYLDDLERHPLFRRHMNVNLEEFKDEIKDEAEELILRNLVNDRGE